MPKGLAAPLFRDGSRFRHSFLIPINVSGCVSFGDRHFALAQTRFEGAAAGRGEWPAAGSGATYGATGPKYETLAGWSVGRFDAIDDLQSRMQSGTLEFDCRALS
jgi:hypothetical protein